MSLTNSYTYRIIILYVIIFIFVEILFMDAKITLSFNEAIATKAKRYADKNNVSLSRLVEFLLDKVTSSEYTSFEDFPVSNWVSQVAEGAATYQTKARSRKSLEKEYYTSKK